MIRSLYTGISGMSGFQEKLDVTSNNIANVNTFGFKKGRQTFSDLMSQTTQGATAPAEGGQIGGQNPMQVGLGSNTGSIDNIHTQGNRQTTNRPLDLAIEGDGMFAVAERTWSTEPDNFLDVLNDVGMIVENDDDDFVAGEDLVDLSDGDFDYDGDVENLEDFEISFAVDGDVDLDDTDLDVDGDEVTLTSLDDAKTLSQLIDNQNDENGTYDDLITQLDSFIDQGDKSVSLEQDNVMFTRAGNFYLDEEGYMVNANGQYLLGDTNTNLTNDEGTGVTNYDGEDTLNSPGRIQIPEGAQSFNIAADGTVNFVDSNGQARVAGQVMLANFSNAEGLTKAGSNNFTESDNSGLMEDGEIGFLNSPGNGGTGNLYAGALEMSNVDLSEEFTSMITAQRGFQANTRVITTSDEILQELVNLKR
ncbi:flagellar hook protein FlgE [Alkalibacillus flavidus]|uniref:Flagellar hook protein FlgE n=1 Tax=Alkalibacillus flavidus TaxID=546021 RepID=A0ABV2KRE0_9BACI